MSTLRRLRRRVVAGQAGYTMLELLMVLAILGTVVGALTTLFVQATNAEFESNRRFQAQQSARVAIDKMRREIHCASAITPSGRLELDQRHCSRASARLLGRRAGRRSPTT